MPGITTTRYVIRTTQGTKGPFTPAEIGRLVEGGRLAPTTRILDVDAKRAVTAAEAMTAASTEATRPIDFDLIRKAALNAQRGQADASDLNIPPAISSEETETVRRPPAPKRAEPLRRKTTEDGLEATDAQSPGDVGLAPAALVRNGEARTPLDRATPRQASEAETPLEQAAVDAGVPVREARVATAPTRRPTGTARRGRDTGPTRATQRRNGPRRRGGASRLVLMLVVVGLLLATAAVALLSYAHRDSYPHQAAELLAYAKQHPDSVDANEGEAGLACILIQHDHQEALEAARNKRGYFDGYKPAYDQQRYLGALREAIAKQVSSTDSDALAGLSRELTAAANPTLSDIAVARRLAQKAVDLDHEKNWRSLDALAWAMFRANDAAKAALIEEQAGEVATDGATKAECASQARVFKGAR